jgi:hypothetical protein
MIGEAKPVTVELSTAAKKPQRAGSVSFSVSVARIEDKVCFAVKIVVLVWYCVVTSPFV